MTLTPLFVDLQGRLVIVTGAGPAALEAARRFAGRGARVRLVGIGAAAAVPAGEVSIEAVDAAPTAAHLERATLLVCASPDRETDSAITDAAQSRGMLVVDMSGSGGGSAHVGDIVTRGRIAVAATTGGASPALEARLARDASRVIAPEHERMAAILEALRTRLEDRFPDAARRDAIWEQILDSPVMVLLQAGDDDEAVEMAERMAWGTG